MATIVFDTHKFVKKLKESGFNEVQAEALSEALKEAQQSSVENLATKTDLRELELRLTGEITLLKWMMGFVLAGIVSLVLKAFFMH